MDLYEQIYTLCPIDIGHIVKLILNIYTCQQQTTKVHWNTFGIPPVEENTLGRKDWRTAYSIHRTAIRKFKIIDIRQNLSFFWPTLNMSYASYEIKCHIMTNYAYDIEIWHKSIWSSLVSKRPAGPQQSHLFIRFWLKNCFKIQKI